MNQKENSKAADILAKARWILPVALWVVLTFFAYEYLYKVEERSLFIFDTFWLKDFLFKPSGILSCAGLFLTQFLHIPWLGALIWVLLLTASAELTRKVYNIPVCLSALTYIPAAIFVAYNMSMGYKVYLMNLHGYFFMPVLGYLWALLTVKVLRKTDNAVASLILFTIWGVAGYYIAGFYSLAGLIAAAADIILSSRSRLSRLLPLIGVAITWILAPVAFVGTTTYNLSNGWIIGMPEKDFGMTVLRMQIPLILAMACLVLAPLSKYANGLTGKRVTLIIQSVVLAAVIAVPSASWFRDDNFKAELAMIRAANNLEWNKAVDILDKLQAKHEKDKTWQPTRVLVLLKDLSLIKTGQDGERIYGFDNGCREQKTKDIVSMSFQIGKILYMHYGIPGMANRWCGEESVLYGWNYQTLQYYAMIALLLDDTQLAAKYLDRLDNTIFYRKWAKKQRKLLGNRELLAKTAPYDMILPLMCYDDIILSDNEGCELFIINHFNGPSPQNSTPLYDRVALMFAMDSKQSTLFWTRFFLYLNSNNPQKIDRFYQEAAYLFSNLDNKEMLETLPFNEKTKSMYKAFMQQASRVGMKSLDEARGAFPANLRHTYFFYFYYVNELQMF
ncbi:MAG: hypothetical protein J5705_06415 [Bacteroidaceae bacterium]|nr:hypothetical protein [Bacteroidaceae bacterium]